MGADPLAGLSKRELLALYNQLTHRKEGPRALTERERERKRARRKQQKASRKANRR